MLNITSCSLQSMGVSVFSCLLPYISAILRFFFSAVTSGLFFFIFIFLLLPGLSLCNLNLCLFCSHPLFRNDISLYLHPTFNFRSLSIRDLFFTISVFKNFQKANRFKLSNLKRSHKLQVKIC